MSASRIQRKEGGTSPVPEGETAKARVLEVAGSIDELLVEERSSRYDGEGEISTEAIFQVLRTERRRILLRYLRNNGPRTTIGEAAEYITAAEAGVTVEEISSSERKSVYTGLYQCHLPKMVDAGVIDFDKDRGTIELREEAAPLFDYIDVTDERSERTRRVDGRGLVFWGTVIVSGLVLAAIAGVPGFTEIPIAVLAVVATATALIAAGCGYLGRP